MKTSLNFNQNHQNDKKNHNILNIQLAFPFYCGSNILIYCLHTWHIDILDHLSQTISVHCYFRVCLFYDIGQKISGRYS
jgi:hypothetical protein